MSRRILNQLLTAGMLSLAVVSSGASEVKIPDAVRQAVSASEAVSESAAPSVKKDAVPGTEKGTRPEASKEASSPQIQTAVTSGGSAAAGVPAQTSAPASEMASESVAAKTDSAQNSSESPNEVPAVLHVPEPDHGGIKPELLYGIGGLAAALLLLGFLLKRKKAKKPEELSSDDEWTPVRVVPYGEEKDKRPEEGQIEAVEKTVSAVIAEEQKPMEALSDEKAEAPEEPRETDSYAGEVPSQEPAEPEEPEVQKMDPEVAYREMVEAQLRAAHDFLIRGASKEAAELARDLSKCRVPEVAAQAKEFLKEIDAKSAGTEKH